MNIEKLREAEAFFLNQYPEGFNDPAIQHIRKKHNVDRLVEFAQENLVRDNCRKPQFVCDTLLTIVNRSSMVSRFEKPPFRQFLESLSSKEKQLLADAVAQRLYSKKTTGFETILDMMQHYKVAKWPLVTAVPFYHSPRREVFVKPTTAKQIIKGLEIENLTYSATPSWEFYRDFRKALSDIRKIVHPSLSPSNAALTGFLMMSA